MAASAAETEVKLSQAQIQSLGVRVAHPISSRTDQTLAFPAQIVIPTPQLWVVSAPVAGMVSSLSVARGDQVKQGQPLMILESPSFVSLQREYLHAVQQEVLVTQQLRRNSELFKGNAVPWRVVETSQTEARQASIAVAERRQMLRLSGISDTALSRLTDEAAITAVLSVNAPEAGTVVDIVIAPGQRIEQSAPLLKLARLSTLWVEIAVPASGVRAIRPGARVDVEGYDTPGRVVLVSETADAATQTVLVRAEVPNTGELRPGQTRCGSDQFSFTRRGRLGDPLQRAHPARRGRFRLCRDRGRFSAGTGHAHRRGPGPRGDLRRNHRQGRGGDQRRIGAAGHSAGARDG